MESPNNIVQPLTKIADLVDSHAHLSFPEYDADRSEVLQRAWDAGLTSIVLIGAGRGLQGNDEALSLAASDDRLFSSVGVHPHDAQNWGVSWEEKLETLLKNEKAVAVGETGLDYHYQHSDPKSQRACFEAQLKLAAKFNRPIIVHDREAHADTLAIIDEIGTPAAGGVMHCFSGDVAFAKEVLRRGFFVSIPGVVTFKNAAMMRDVVKELQVENMLVETDCPYLAPVPYRGKRNEPAFVAEVVRSIAEIKGLSVADVARITARNAKKLFKLAAEAEGEKIAYEIRDSLYLNVTNRCRLACTFCPKYTNFEVKGYNLELKHEPSVDEILASIKDVAKYPEIVFCGYGEPTSRLEMVLEVAKRLKKLGAKKIRLNTDGLAGLVSGEAALEKLVEVIDSFSVSMNAPDSVTYARVCPSRFGEDAFEAMGEFVRFVKASGREIIVSVVALPGLDISASEALAKSWGVKLRVREYMSMG